MTHAYSKSSQVLDLLDFHDFIDNLDADEIATVPGVFEPLAKFYLWLVGRKVDFRDEDELDGFLEFVAEQEAQELLTIPGVRKPLAKYYTEVSVVESTFAPAWNPGRNPAGVVKTAQDERDWEKAKAYYARGTSRPESRWESPDWATVMVIFKNIKAKRQRRRGR